MLATAVILLVSFVVMQFTDKMGWSLSDFVIIGFLLIGTGLIHETLASKMKNKTYKVVLAVVLVLAMLLIWGTLAVGDLAEILGL